MASKRRQQPHRQLVRSFMVSDPNTHDKGHTIYKITYTAFPIDSPELSSEVVVWRRYNDFKKLNQCLLKIHKSLHKREEFPPFAKAKLFGRFEQEVIEERMKCGLELLNFAGKMTHLYTAAVFEKFFEPSVVNLHVPSPQNHDIKTAESEKNSASTQGPSLPNSSLTDDSFKDELEASLGGVWKYRQNPDDISFNSDEDTDFTDDSALSTPLPDADISFFDPLREAPEADEPSELHHSSSWLFLAMSECAEMDERGNVLETPDKSARVGDDVDAAVGLTIGTGGPEKSPNHESDSCQVEIKHVPGDAQASKDVVSEYDPFKIDSQSASNECGTSSFLADPIVMDRPLEPPKSPIKQGLSNLMSRVANRNRSRTAESVTNMDLGTNHDYIYQAANQISLAKECESTGNYEVAFGYYKNGVGVLLKGVQEDPNRSRRDAVRRKTAQYLLKAEDLYNRHIASKREDRKRWATDSKISPSAELDPRIAYLQGPVSELRNYKVIGIIDKVMLVMDTTSEQSFVIKTLQKCSIRSSRNNIIPTHCPHMVQFYKFYETHSSIFILMHHAVGGKLWAYVSGYLHNQPKDTELEDILNDSHERRLRQGTMTSTETIKCQSSSDAGQGQLSDAEDDDLKAAPTECSSYVELCTNYVGLKSDEYRNEVHGETHNRKGMRPVVQKCDSLGFEESPSVDLHSSLDYTPEMPGNDAFQNVLEQNRPSLDNFAIGDSISIGSADYNEPVGRRESNLSETIDAIAEASEPAQCTPKHKPMTTSHDPDTQSLISNAQELIDSVSKMLVESDTEVGDIVGAKMNNLESFTSRNSSTPLDDTFTKGMFEKTNEEKELKSTEDAEDGCPEPKRTKNKNKVNLKLDLSAIERDVSRCSPPYVSPGSGDPDRQQMSDAKHTARCTSVERSLDTPTSARKRALSSVSVIFQELDLAAEELSKNCHLPERCVRQWASEIVVAVHHLHTLGVILRDLHPGNILLGEGGHVLLTYFSQWCFVTHTANIRRIENGYRAPELKGPCAITEACDWWSVGALLYELFTGNTLLCNHPGGLNRHAELNLPQHLSSEAQSLLVELLRYNPSERMGSGVNGIDGIKMHPFFSGINWE